MFNAQQHNNTFTDAVSKIDEIVELMLDSYHSIDRCPKVEKLERIVRSVELKQTQLKQAAETGDVDEVRIIIPRIFKKVTRFYRVLNQL